MRYIALLIALALPLGAQITVNVDTTDAAQKTAWQALVAARAADLAAAAALTAAWVDSVGMDSTLTAAGVKVVADTKDSQWVQIDVPLSSATGFALAFWKGVLGEFVADGGQLTATIGRVRTSKGKAVKGLVRLRTVLQGD